MQVPHLITVVALFVSLAALIVAIKTLSVNKQSRRLADQSSRNDLIAHLRTWSDRVIDALADSIGVVQAGHTNNNSDFLTRKASLQIRLSALVDQGRLFFPNTKECDYGIEKLPPYRGYRHPVLDLILVVYFLLDTRCQSENASQDGVLLSMVHVKRAFVSSVYFIATGPLDDTFEALQKRFSECSVGPLPAQIREIIGDVDAGFQVEFKDEQELVERYTR